MTKLKVLAAADIHADTTTAKRLAKKAKKAKVDLVILCGDLTFFNKDAKNLIKPFTDLKQKVLLIPGNHDTFATTDFLAEFYGVKNIHGYSVKYKDVGIFGCGGVKDLGLDSITEKEIFSNLKKGFSKVKQLKKKIMVTHVHAKGTKAEFSGFEGSSGVQKAVQKFKPDILFSGHIHEAEGIEEKIGNTKVINVGKKGTIVEI